LVYCEEEMDEILIPEWIKKIKAENDSELAKSQANAQRLKVLALKIKYEGPELWKKLLKELDDATRALSMIGIGGQISTSSTRDEQVCRVDVQLQGAFPRMTHVNLFCAPTSGNIRCCTGEGQASKFFFALQPDDVLGLTMEDCGIPVDPERAAQVIVQGMLTTLKSDVSCPAEL